MNKNDEESAEDLFNRISAKAETKLRKKQEYNSKRLSATCIVFIIFMLIITRDIFKTILSSSLFLLSLVFVWTNMDKDDYFVDDKKQSIFKF